MTSASGSVMSEIKRVQLGSDDHLRTDILAVEEPLEIRLGLTVNGKVEHKAVSITMRTPGDDGELAAGFLFTEGILNHADQVKQIGHCGPKIGKGNGAIDRASALNSNTIRVDLNEGVEVDLKTLDRHFYTTSSCGVCGKSSIEALSSGLKTVQNDEFRVSSKVIHTLPEILRSSQNVFEQTGGLHASALFTADGKLDIVREDVGRHNALDKVIGAKFLAGELPLTDRILLVSGRVSFELVQKALMAGIPLMAAVGAPSSLAVELAAEYGMTVVGFVRDQRFNIYSVPKRVIQEKS